MPFLLLLFCFNCLAPDIAPLPEQCSDYQSFVERFSALSAYYEKALGVYKNPFLFTFTTEEANAIYNSLLRRPNGFFCEESSLFAIQEEIKTSKNYRIADLNKLLLEKIIEDSRDVLARNEASLHERQSLLIAVKTALEYLSRFYECYAEQVSDTQQSKKQESEQDEPDFDEPSNEYTPYTKDLSKLEKKNTKKIVAEVPFKTPVFGNVIYSFIARNRPLQTSALLDENMLLPAAVTGEYTTMLVRTCPSKQFQLLLPAGYVPAQGQLDGAIIKPDGKGSYRVQLERDIEQFTVPLKKRIGDLSDFQKELYTRPVGFALEEWPDDIQANIIHKFSPAEHSAAEIAQAIVKHFGEHYTYSMKAQPETDPIDALKARSFQCDMAAYSMASLLRDVFAIPARIVAGYSAQRKTNKSLLVLPNTGHAWVEVFHDGEWHTYDPTPPGGPDDAEETEASDDNQSRTQEQSAVREWQPATNITEHTQDNQKPDDQPQTTDDEFIFPELAKVLEGIDFSTFTDMNVLRKHILKTLLRELLNPLFNSEESSHKLNLFKSLLTKFTPKDDLVFQALLLHKEPHDRLLNWLKDIEMRLFARDINLTYQDLARISRILSTYQKVAENDVPSALIDQIVHKLQMALSELLPLKDADAWAMALAEDFKKQSPALLWKMLQRDYSLTAVGPNPETIAFAHDVEDGKHNDKRLINELYDYTNFILNADTRKGSTEVKTWLRDQRKPGLDVLPLQRIDDWRRGIFTRHDLDPFENIAGGYAYLLAKRKKVTLPTEKNKQETERITIVGFDTSGSMSGNNAEFQAGLIAAFVCRALNDVSPSGRQRHRVLLVPFDDTVKSPIKVSTTQDALNLIRDHRELLANTGGGTDIQAFLLQAIKLIADAQDQKNPFDIANIILMTDGQSPLDYEELKRARQSIHRSTPLQTMFIAIGDTNPELIKFATESQKLGAQEGSYKEFLGHEIDTILNRTHKVDRGAYNDYFYSSKSAEQIPFKTREYIHGAHQMASTLALYLQQESAHGTNYREFIEPLKIPHAKELYSKRSLENWIHEVRQMLAYHKGFHDERILSLVLYSLMQNFEKLAGLKFSDLNHYETEQLIHLLETPLAEA